MKIATTFIAAVSLWLSGCSNSEEPVEVVVKQDGSSRYAIHITVEGKKDVVIDDPYEDKIQELSRAFASERDNFIENRANMSSEQRKAYGKLRDSTAAQIRELDKLRRAYIRSQLEAYEGVGFTLETRESSTSTQDAKDYFDSLEN
ncbi:hypothetical protein [Pelagicoccus sp. SDUM812002]|uniref:hypothetical protein n=1 Tax=Pelagicoccus sp. SDUM812002 TaxID=3041266 RepID=UPI00280FD207|nr:hypothetical protein [Pelagicoccus sp. SDUM812002]MDQ8184240.1 hypothetical protein [Pelagicoccus sp. SDUM812002]